MSELAPLSPVDLRIALARRFDVEELRTLCFDLGVDYDDLRGEGKAAKARELVAFMERRGILTELETVVRCLHPDLAISYSYERVQELKTSILTASQPDIRDAFIEFTQQTEAYLNKFNLLHEQLEEWKEVHNLLQDLQFNFAPCRNYIAILGGLADSATRTQEERDRSLFEIEVEWRPCRRCLRKLQQLATSTEAIGEPYEPESGSGPDWFLKPWRIAVKTGRALLDSNIAALPDHLSAFGDQVDQSLFVADKALRDIVSRINRLPRPGSHIVRS